MTTLTPGDRDLARFNAAIRQLYLGGSNNTGKVTLRAGQTTTTVVHEGCNPNSHVSLMPLTASAVTAMLSDPPLPTLTAFAPKIITATRVLSAANGNVSYTGVGFKPTVVEFIAGISGSTVGHRTPYGFDDGTHHFSTTELLGATNSQTFQNIVSLLIGDDAAGGNFASAAIASMDVDGFTLTWTKNGTPTATATFAALCSPPAPVINTSAGASGVRVTARTTGSFTLTHPSSAAVDQTFTYSVTGGQ